jgi:hypothetical protein
LFNGDDDSTSKHLDLIAFLKFQKLAIEEGIMGNIRTFFLLFAAIFLLSFFTFHALAADKISVVQYELKPIASVDSGRYIKTEWSAKLRNNVSETVKFSMTIIFVDSDNETLKETTSKGELNPHQTKTFKDTVLVEASVAGRIASTRATVEEMTE